jgi:hypothetical protein
MEEDTLSARYVRELSLCAVDGYCFSHMEKPETIANLRSPYIMTGEAAARLCALGGVDMLGVQ